MVTASPIVESVSVAFLPLMGGEVTVTGANFAAGSSVSVGGSICRTVVHRSSTSITCAAPELAAAGAQSVVVSVGNLASNSNVAVQYLGG